VIFSAVGENKVAEKTGYGRGWNGLKWPSQLKGYWQR